MPSRLKNFGTFSLGKFSHFQFKSTQSVILCEGLLTIPKFRSLRCIQGAFKSCWTGHIFELNAHKHQQKVAIMSRETLNFHIVRSGCTFTLHLVI